MSHNAFGVLSPLPGVLIIAGAVILLFVLGFYAARGPVWSLAWGLFLWGLGAALWVWILWAVLSALALIRPLRRGLITAPILRFTAFRGILPSISETEREALEAGTTWIEGDIFSGKPDFRRLLAETYPTLTERERAFLEGPVEEVCRMADEWDIHRRSDLSAEVWNYLKEERFFGMVIPREYGGLGFSATAMSAVVTKLGSRSVTLAVDVMVPNSLGPAELLIHYGTREQKEHYLPRLATGEEMPAFALTEPEAGSDAAGMTSSGEVFRGEDGERYMRLNWDKRYITLAPVATVLGLAFKLRDPENLLGRGEDLGITVGLIPTDREGVVTGLRHDPLQTPFLNGPTQGRDVVLSLDHIVGGPEQAGRGWHMLMETLAAGRGIFLPALSIGGGKAASRIAGAYAAVRRQFGLPIGRFEGVQELLAPIGGLTYTMEAAGRFTCGALDQGIRPAVVSALLKYNTTEFNRRALNLAMDLEGGTGIVLGRHNLLGHPYFAVPIAITVEGSNILTRSLIVFGQGLIQSHPYAYRELKAMQSRDAAAFDEAVREHFRMIVRNLVRTGLLGISRGSLAGAPVGGPTARYYRRLSWASARFALLADLALFGLGGRLQRMERLSGRFADVLSWVYMGMSVLRRFEAEGRRTEDLPLVEWSMENALGEIQNRFQEIFDDFPVPLLRAWMRGPASMWVRINPLGRGASDRAGKKVAALLQQPGPAREHLTEGMYIPEEEDDTLGQLERAFRLTHAAESLYARIRDAISEGTLPHARPNALVEEARGADVISQAEYDLIMEAEEARREATRVDAFTRAEMPIHMA